eukprot:m.17020 g.17020  ORF g.17020 m.17020 type:complete len:1039 (-) comp3200_c0_seq1:343-3459(-)
MNAAQERACTSAAPVVVVHAGPGSGKTRVITQRVAWLIRECHVPPSAIVLVTFTNKAANEMKERVQEAVGAQAGHVVMGTFHSIASRFLRKHAALIGLNSSFTIQDESRSLQVLREAIQATNPSAIFQARGLMAEISQMKSAPERKSKHRADVIDLNALMQAYNSRLAQANALDFDDLLVRLRELLQGHPHVLRDITHVLVDEFQDTNSMQYTIVKLLAAGRSLSIVGDPDQSIYGWRQADSSIFMRVKHDFPAVELVHLTQSYRCTGRILRASDAVLHGPGQLADGGRMWTANGEGPTVVYLQHETDDAEAIAVAAEIERVHRLEDLALSSFCILLRTNAMARPFERALCSAGIPYRIAGGARMLDRADAKDLLAYLRLIGDLGDDEAFARAVNAPKRGFGPAFLERLAAVAKTDRASHFRTLAKEVKGDAKTSRRLKLPANVFTSLKAFVTLIEELHRDAVGTPTPFGVADSRMPAVDVFAAAIDRSGYIEGGTARSDALHALEALAATADAAWMRAPTSSPPLLAFLESIRPQYAATEASEAVTISTIHAAKGLEYACVFVAGVQEGLLPHGNSISQLDQGMSESIEEERRLLFVAMTRAKVYLHMSWASSRSDDPNAGSLPSRFVEPLLPKPGSREQVLATELEADDAFAQRFAEVKTGPLAMPSDVTRAVMARARQRIQEEQQAAAEALAARQAQEARMPVPRRAASAGLDAAGAGASRLARSMSYQAGAPGIGGAAGFQRASSLVGGGGGGGIVDNSGLGRMGGGLTGQAIGATIGATKLGETRKRGFVCPRVVSRPGSGSQSPVVIDLVEEESPLFSQIGSAPARPKLATIPSNSVVTAPAKSPSLSPGPATLPLSTDPVGFVSASQAASGAGGFVSASQTLSKSLSLSKGVQRPAAHKAESRTNPYLLGGRAKPAAQASSQQSLELRAQPRTQPSAAASIRVPEVDGSTVGRDSPLVDCRSDDLLGAFDTPWTLPESERPARPAAAESTSAVVWKSFWKNAAAVDSKRQAGEPPKAAAKRAKTAGRAKKS